MSIRWRLTLTYTGIMALMLFMFGLGVYYITSQTLLVEMDENLVTVAGQISERTEAVLLQDDAVPIVTQDLGMFEAAAIFIMLVDPDGNVLDSSENISGFSQLLDPDGLLPTSHMNFVMQRGRNLRVLSLPLRVESEGRERIIGYLQVGTLADGYFSSLRRLGWSLVLTGFAAITLSLLVGSVYTPSSLKSLNTIASVAQRITHADDLGRRLPDTGRHDEIGHLTQALNSTLERLEQLFRTQQRFLADISHELRTPLTAVRGNVDLMRRMGDGDPESLDAMQEELERMSRLVRDLLFLARADSGGLPIQQVEVELDTIFLEVFRQMHRLPKHVDVSLETVDQIRVCGDTDRLKQVIFILVDNAIKYTPLGGKVTMGLSMVGDRALIRVTDTGAGIPPEDLPYIFDRFYRVDKARTRTMGGSGLGLSIAQWVVEAHGGEIIVTSEPGKGSTFDVYLPVLPQEDAKAASLEDTQPTRPRSRRRALAGFLQQGNNSD